MKNKFIISRPNGLFFYGIIDLVVAYMKDILDYLNIQIFKPEFFTLQLLEASRSGDQVFENEVNKINNLSCARKVYFKIRDIFSEYWELFELGNPGKIRPSVKENVEAMIRCKDLSNGYLAYECPNCHKMHFQGLSCNSRFCSSCGNRYREERAISISQKCLNKPHRHFVFSIAWELRPYFVHPLDRDALLDILFNAVEFAFEALAQDTKKGKKENRQFGYILFLHTYGRAINWIPHIHCLICEGYMNNKNEFKKRSHFPYVKLKKTFMFHLNNTIRAYFKKNKSEKEYKDIVSLTKSLEKKHTEGYYAYGPKLDSKCDTRISTKKLTEYVARYASHPAIAESRITGFDKLNHTVSYYYDPHEDDLLDENDPNRLGRQYITESVFKFMKKLCRHIPNKGFHNVRYYGFYSNRDTHDKSKYQSLYTANQIKKMKSNIHWNKKMKLTYNYEPLLCSCGKRMELCYELSFFPDTRGHPRQLSIFDYDEEGNLYA